MKYFHKLGVNFSVVAGAFTGKSPWDKDISCYANQICRVDLKPLQLPYHLKSLPKNFAQKVLWKLSLFFWESRKRYFVGNYRDLSVPNKELFLLEVERLIRKNNVSTLILSVGPFNYSSILIEVRNKFPQIKLVLDFRDYWEDDFVGLTDAQCEHEREAQRKVISAVDLILAPNEEMYYYYTGFKKPVYLLPHCIDTDDFQRLALSKAKLSNTMELVYGGAFYAGISKTLTVLTSFVDKLKKQHPVHAEFFVSVKGYEMELTHPCIERRGIIDSDLYFDKVINSDYVLLILPENRKNARSSKFFELVALRKPILYFGPAGFVSDFITDKKLGFHITEQNIDQMVPMIVENKTSQTVPADFDLSEYSFEYQTKLLLNRINEL